ncbi:MAG: M48 family peptidase [SAR86 cluster bacterium]|jgi:predicted Zn-dependent protease|uniref:M48 family peptidase n=1 Tax=SAR86 cluster bacterium TaxID=2030880 RepID=A0A520N0Z4_9GAMM|nr:MAG: M48 family peptidase [SAR86 cluster bacterium]|tara:strand:+ start:110 stop:1546 length:1437 start_codon:yes stop_codon:yes gene_type:complete
MKILITSILTIFISINLVAFNEGIKEIDLPELGDRVSGAVSSDEEKAIGEMFLQQVYSNAPLISDPIIFEYTEHLIYRLSEYSQVKDRYFKILLIDDDSLNAFAAPGGIIGVNGGLFLYSDNEGQFSSVLAHELAHLSQRHFARNVLKSQDSNLASALVMVSSIAIALISNNPNAMAVGPAILQSQSLRYSRLFEKEADRVGFANLVKAGYHPESMGEMFENMNEIRRLSGDLPPEFLLTHPLSSSRISDAFNAAENLPTEGTKKNSLEFSLIKARLEIYYENIFQNSVRKFRERVNQDPTESNLYGLALAHQKNNNYEESLELINRLISSYPKNLVLNNTKVDFLFESGKYEDALVHVNKFLEISPRNYPLSISKSKILLSMERYFESEEIIRDQLLRKNNNPDLWLLLSEIQRSSKNIIGYHQSRAEYFLLLGQNERALNQLEFALKLTQNNFQVSERIMTKMVEIKKEINESRGL